MPYYKGIILGFKYETEQPDNATFKAWIKAKMKRYVFFLEIDGVEYTNNQEVIDVINELLTGT